VKRLVKYVWNPGRRAVPRRLRPAAGVKRELRLIMVPCGRVANPESPPQECELSHDGVLDGHYAAANIRERLRGESFQILTNRYQSPAFQQMAQIMAEHLGVKCPHSLLKGPPGAEELSRILEVYGDISTIILVVTMDVMQVALIKYKAPSYDVDWFNPRPGAIYELWVTFKPAQRPGLYPRGLGYEFAQ
jgi:hypothetical protein